MKRPARLQGGQAVLVPVVSLACLGAPVALGAALPASAVVAAPVARPAPAATSRAARPGSAVAAAGAIVPEPGTYSGSVAPGNPIVLVVEPGSKLIRGRTDIEPTAGTCPPSSDKPPMFSLAPMQIEHGTFHGTTTETGAIVVVRYTVTGEFISAATASGTIHMRLSGTGLPSCEQTSPFIVSRAHASTKGAHGSAEGAIAGAGGAAPDATGGAAHGGAARPELRAAAAGQAASAVVSDGLGFCALLASGGVSCWGSNSEGALGYGGGDFESYAPLAVKGLTGATSVVADRGGGRYGYCALLRSGAVACWGNDGGGTSKVAQVVGGLSGVRALASDGTGYCAVTAGGSVRCWGTDEQGELGDGGHAIVSSTPLTVAGVSGATAVASDRNGGYCALVSGGRVECWGNGGGGSLGDGRQVADQRPAPVAGLSGATALASDVWGYCALVAGGARCWGIGTFGGLGNGATTSLATTPVAVKGLSGAVQLVGAGYAGHGYCALLRSGGVSCWGSNLAGSLGDGSSEALSDVPVSVRGVSGASVLAGAPGSWCAGGPAGAECWGSNADGELGDGSGATSAGTAEPVHGLRAVTSIAAGPDGYCALAAGGVLCWGSDTFGQLGDGSEKPFTTDVPVRVAGLSS